MFKVRWLQVVPQEVRAGLAREIRSLELDLDGYGKVGKIHKRQEGLSKRGTALHNTARGINRAKPFSSRSVSDRLGYGEGNAELWKMRQDPAG